MAGIKNPTLHPTDLALFLMNCKTVASIARAWSNGVVDTRWCSLLHVLAFWRLISFKGDDMVKNRFACTLQEKSEPWCVELVPLKIVLMGFNGHMLIYGEVFHVIKDERTMFEMWSCLHWASVIGRKGVNRHFLLVCIHVAHHMGMNFVSAIKAEDLRRGRGSETKANWSEGANITVVLESLESCKETMVNPSLWKQIWLYTHKAKWNIPTYESLKANGADLGGDLDQI